MTNLTPERLLRHAIGYDPLLRFVETVSINGGNFPPHNIDRLGDEDSNRYRLTLAVAGFAREEIDVLLHKGVLTVKGSRASEEIDDGSVSLYRGIAFRDFDRQFSVGENVEVTSAKLDHGLLIVEFERIVPEEDRPKQITIR